MHGNAERLPNLIFLLYIELSVFSSSSMRSVVCNARKNKGFGGTSGGNKSAKATASKKQPGKKKAKGLSVSRPIIPGQDMPGMMPMEEEKPDPEKLLQEQAFEKRLAAMKEKTTSDGVQRQKESVAAASAEIDYSNPPPLSATLASMNAKGDSPLSSGRPPAATMDGSSQEPNKLLVGLGGLVPIVLGVVLIITSGALDGVGSSPSAVSTQSDSISPEERKGLEMTLARLETRLKDGDKDEEVIEGLAVTLAELGRYSDAEARLQQLVETRSDDPEVWRLLGETRAQQSNYKGAADAFSKSIATTDGAIGLEQLQGYVGVLATDGKGQQAIDYVEKVKKEGSSGLSDVELGLLTAKVYSQWKGHSGDALAKYDDLLVTNPQDFRIYLAKGQMLKAVGRPSDADRMFIQAKYWAPEEAKRTVMAMTKQ